VLVLTEDSLNCLILVKHLLVVTATLDRSAGLDAVAHQSMNATPLLIGIREVEELPLAADEHQILDVLSLAPVVPRIRS
jgi:hypothetical protein